MEPAVKDENDPRIDRILELLHAADDELRDLTLALVERLLRRSD